MAAQDGFLGSDTRETLSSGKQTVGEMLSAAQHKLRRVFLVFVIGLVLTIYLMRIWIWPVLKRDLLPRLPGASNQPETVAITPFDVILMQAKVGIVVGIVLAIPLFLYYARDPLKARGWYPEDGLATPKVIGVAAMSIVLFFAGIVYSYNLFFPITFDFLAKNANNAGLVNSYSIVYWTEFIFILAFSFGVAAQLPLFITALSYWGIVPYEVFRDNWRYAVVGMFAFGAFFSPPDPFTQAMWAGPLVLLYGVSLYLARLAVAFKRGGSLRGMAADVRANLHRVTGVFVAAAAVGWLFLTRGVPVVNDEVIPRLPAGYRPGTIDPAALAPAAGETGLWALAAGFGLFVAGSFALYYAWPSLNPDSDGEYGDPTAIDLGTLDAAGVRAAPPEAFADMEEEEALAAANEAMDDDQPGKAKAILDRYDEVEEASEEGGEGADAAAADGDAGTAEGEGATPPGRVERATATMFDSITDEDTDPDDIGGYYHDIRFILSSLRSKAFRIFAVFIAVMVGTFYFLYQGGIGRIKRDFLARLPDTLAAASATPINGSLANASLTNGTLSSASVVNGTLAKASAMNASLANATLTNGILSSATVTNGTVTNASAANGGLANVSIANATLANASVTNSTLTAGGTNTTFSNVSIVNATLEKASILNATLANATGLNGSVAGTGGDLASQVKIVNLHPVEALVFEVKISVLLGAVATLPVLLYYAWPALKERGIASGDRNIFFGWAGAVAAGLFIGSVIGYAIIAPTVISYLVWDALQANMEIAYRVSNFFWLIFFTTVGIGLLMDIPVTMVLFHRGGIVSYSTLRDRWRVAVIATLVIAGLVTPTTVLSMILVTIPVMLAYGLGLGILWLYTFRERRTPRVTPESG